MQYIGSNLCTIVRGDSVLFEKLSSSVKSELTLIAI